MDHEQEMLVIEQLTKLAASLGKAHEEIVALRAIVNTLVRHQPNLEDIADDLANSISIASYESGATHQDDHVLLIVRNMLEKIQQEILRRKRVQ